MKPRIIICGLDRNGYKIFCLLKQQGACVVGINDKSIPGEESNIVVGDLRAAATLIASGIESAQTLVLAGADDALNLAILIQARVLNPQIRIINRLFNTSLGDRLDQTLPDHVTMSVAALAAPVFAFEALGNRAIGQLQLFNQIWPIHEEYIDEFHPWKGRQLHDLWNDRSRMLIYYLPVDGQIDIVGNSRNDLVTAVVHGHYLRTGDRLIIGTQPNIRITRKSLIQKLLKIVTSLRYIRQHAQSVLLVALVLFVTILVATFTYICVNLQTTVVDALYFSVGMITGAGGNDRVAEQAPDSIKLFTVFMMLIGAVVIGIWYALLNDFVLGTRLKQFWDAARVPQRNHYIICGLGGVGIQIVQQLLKQGHEVVVVESDPNNRFLNTARLLGVPAIQGDASLAATLQTANISQAAALLIATSQDAVNLEIALTAKGINPRIPVIVRYEDPDFAHMAQQVFEFESVLSPAELAAPAFAAAALGGRILGNGLTGNSLWVALATLITPAHPFCHQRVQEAAMSSDFVPLYVETKCQTVHGWNLLNFYLSAGDVLYLTMPASRLDQLWRASPSQLTEVKIIRN